jgi:hypothetical protein
MSLWCTQGQLPFTIVLEEWFQYLYGRNSVPHKMRAVWSYRTVCHRTVLCCVKTQNVVIWWLVSKGKLGNLCACWFSFCVMFIYCPCVFICSSALTAVMICNFHIVFPKFWRVWHASHTGHNIWDCLKLACVCVFYRRVSSVQNSPLHCRPY